MLKLSQPKALVMMSLGVAFNIVLGFIAQRLNIPFVFLDTIGTIFIAVLLGPTAGVWVGLVTNLVLGVVVGPDNFYFAPLNMIVGLVSGLMAKRFGFKLPIAIVTGLILAVVVPLIATPIIIWVYGGASGRWTDGLIAWMRASGNTLFSSVYVERVISNLIDKIGSALLVSLALVALPSGLLKSYQK